MCSTNMHFLDVCSKLLNIKEGGRGSGKNQPSVSKFVNLVLTMLMVQFYHDAM